ncbi:MAG: hypothetical protein LBE92_02650 [Chryseobacterium sp.]|jgi:hypothetical protein|uniref:hypothetical protein n=1 Tax=Chryseobacterium sp. TaxID=1871047 RepID=UPI002831BBC9|nr:hypothetical protein [Chryseobacterium sp.]MDR2234999.1 hypothetical protein [Chryseobacterium sp.]
MVFKIPKVDEAEAEILKEKRGSQNFPKTTEFPFSESYKNLVTAIKTTEIASDAILYNAVEAVNENKESGFAGYWCFAGTGQGDRWLLDHENKVFFYDHDAPGDFMPMEINFGQWLQLAFLIQQLDQYFDEFETIPESVKKDFDEALNRISPGLSELYPFGI